MANFCNSRNGNDRKRGGSMCEINITPMVDVMLVLLVIFMVTSPMLVNNINIDLPQAATGPSADTNVEPLSITVDNSGKVYIKNYAVERKDLKKEIETWSHGDRDRRIHIRGDKTVNYGDIMDVIADINAAGYQKVVLVTAVRKS